MTARFHSAALHRVAVPAWLLAVVIAAAFAASLLAVIDIAGDPGHRVVRGGLPAATHHLHRLKPRHPHC